MHAAQRPSKVLKGLSFDIADLVLIRTRSEAHDLRMVVRLDHGSDVEEYEEVLAFHSGTSSSCQWLMWRNESAVFVRSINGRARRYLATAQAIEALVRKQRVVLTGTNATHCKLDPVRTLADGISDTVAGDADPYALMGAFVEAAVHTLASRISADRQTDAAAVLWQLLTDRLEQRGLLPE
jgi:hypothetical protein